MDLRIVKTLRNIRETFLELRAENALEKIRVTRLCEMALINKTTFYSHYQDIYALSEEIEDETILSIMGSFEHINSLFTDPDLFMRGLYEAFMAHEELIMILFSDRMNILIDKIENHLLSHYPQINDRPEKGIMLSFLLWGGSHVLMESRYEPALLLDTLTGVARQIIPFSNVQNTA